MFEEFYAADISRVKGPVGLDLSNIKEFVKQLHQTIKSKI